MEILISIEIIFLFFTLRITNVFLIRIYFIHFFHSCSNEYLALPGFYAMVFHPRYQHLWTKAQWVKWVKAQRVKK